MKKGKSIASLVMNAVIVICTTAIVFSYFNGNTGTLIEEGYETFKFFTTDSNILCAISALIALIFDIRIISGKSAEIQNWAVVLKFVGTTSVMVTFTTVMVLLGPLYGYDRVLSGTAFYMHLAGPLLALVSFCVFEPYCILRKRVIHLTVLPMAVYGAVYSVEVLIIGKFNGGWSDFYGLNIGGRWYISIFAMVAGTYTLAVIIRLLHNLASKRHIDKIGNTV